MSDMMDDYQSEDDFRTLTRAEKIKSHPERHKAALMHAVHAKKVLSQGKKAYGSIEQMMDEWHNARNEKAMMKEDEQEKVEEGHPLKDKNHPEIHKDAIRTKQSDQAAAEDEEAMGTNGPTGDKVHYETPKQRAAMKAVKQRVRG